MGPVGRCASDLLAGIVNAQSLVDGTPDLRANDWLAPTAVSLDGERETGSRGFQRGMKRHASFFSLGGSVLGHIDCEPSIFVLLRLDPRIARVKDSSAVTLRRSVGKHLIRRKRANQIFQKAQQNPISKRWSAHRGNLPPLRKKK